jgi:hypothetical protein
MVLAMRYEKTVWTHSKPNFPRVIYNEINEQGWELRKVEIFPDGTYGFAGTEIRKEPTGLSETPIEPLFIAPAKPPLDITSISKEEFEDIWLKATT